jgi:hypothetical protein
MLKKTGIGGEMATKAASTLTMFLIGAVALVLALA